MLNFDSLRTIFSGYDAYLVGGGARYTLQGGEQPKDWDILITDQLPNLPFEYVLNKFGGRRYPKLKLDVWQSDIGRFLRQVPRGLDGIAIHLETGAVFMTKEFIECPNSTVTGRPVITPMGFKINQPDGTFQMCPSVFQSRLDIYDDIKG